MTKIQNIVDLVPDVLKPVLRPIYRVIKAVPLFRKPISALTHRKTREEIHTYWKQPWDRANLPKDYLVEGERSKFLVNLVKKYAEPQSRILEIGCNVGRNLNYLFFAGFKQLAGIEINEEAVKLLRQAYPEMARHAKIINESAEEALRKLQDDAFDITFTMAVLEHIHPESEFIFPEMVRITRGFLITIEDERDILSWRIFPRNYRKVFQSLGLKQIDEYNWHQMSGLKSNFFARVFKKL